MIKKNYRRFFTALGRFFLLVLLLVFVINLILPDRGFSEKENRVLSSFPKISISQLTSGKTATKFESYTNDQFFARDIWVWLKANTDRLLGKVESNGVYLGKNGYLFEDFTAPSDDAFRSTVQALTDFASNHSDLKQYALIAPTAINILSDYLPAAAPVADQNKYLDQLGASLSQAGVNWIDVRETFLSHRNVQLYYRTDHHWTTAAAYYAYLQASDVMNLNTGLVSYEQLPVTTKFQGTLSAKSGFRSGETDAIYVFLPKEGSELSYYVNYLDDQKKVGSFYETAKLETRDKYAMFFNGNHAQVRIITPSAEDRTLLVLKDSYANCFLPFLAPHYRNIIVVDPRYYYGNLDNLIAAENVTEIMYLYNANTFFTDHSLEMTVSSES